jgi:sugar/nucleoside kinase (ribokinase family)
VIALLGNLARDLLPGEPPRPGGAPYHSARALRRLHVPGLILARCAVDDRAALFDPVVRLGTTARFVPGTSTASFEISYEGDHRLMGLAAIGDTWRPEDVPSLPDAVRWVHVAPLARSDFPAETIAALARDGRRLLLDAQGVVRLGTTGPLAEDSNVDPAIFRELAILTMNELEAQALVGGTDPERLRSLGVAEVVLTRASRGAVAVTGGQATEIPAARVEGAVDPTGAGDSFALVYLEARSRGAEPAEAGAHAARVVAELIARP